MTSPAPPRPSCPFTAPERELIRLELCQHFGQFPSVADGLFLRTWKSGPQAGQPKLPPAAQSMLARGLVEVRVGQRWPWPRAFLTEAGLTALRELAQSPRLLNPERYAHLLQELGLEVKGAGQDTDAATAAE